MVAKTARLLGALAAAAIATVVLGVPGCGGGAQATGGQDASVDGDDDGEAATIIGADSAPARAAGVSEETCAASPLETAWSARK